ncbi:amino acid permease [Candidatus Neptunichlamydia sp. REUL1]|uniref:amino acid permease n=1 Tax=Candidatus Neptunichlamydia sp. REUL1 TaxID=3064277 RepID=UPI00292DD6CD|nr:amino acid permease [Candidatus Neptunochlamydia sp. REUL1]
MTKSSGRTLNIFFLAMINIAAICSIKNWPLTAVYGFSSLFYFIVSIVLFFIPVSLVSAELATGWPERGGVYVWVREAFGHRWGFLAGWLLWIENVVWYPTILSFIAGTIAFSFDPSLADNTLYMFCVIFGTFWGATLLNLLGMKMSGWISTLGVILGTIIPGVVIIGLGIAWVGSGKPSHIAFNWDTFFPDLSSPKQLALLAGVLLGFAGMEMSAVHAKDVKNPQKNFPRAILLSASIIIILSILGTLAIAIVIPEKKISLVSGGIEAIAFFLRSYNLGWAVPVIAFMVAFGALGAMSTWTAGPSKGLLAAAQDGDFPPILHKINKHNMPVGMLVFQGVIVSVLGIVFLLMPNVNSSFWILLALTSQLYLLMYVIMFAAGIRLRYKRPDVHRAYKIPGGKFGMWLTAGVGLVSSALAIFIGFFPPDQLETGSPLFYVLFLVFGMILFCAAPFIILLFKKPSWNEPISFQDED